MIGPQGTQVWQPVQPGAQDSRRTQYVPSQGIVRGFLPPGGYMTTPAPPEPPQRPLRSMNELSESGLLWLINRSVFHPRGFALALDGDAWTMLGNGSEPWSFPEDVDRDRFLAVEQTLWQYGQGP